MKRYLNFVLLLPLAYAEMCQSRIETLKRIEDGFVNKLGEFGRPVVCALPFHSDRQYTKFGFVLPSEAAWNHNRLGAWLVLWARKER